MEQDSPKNLPVQNQSPLTVEYGQPAMAHQITPSRHSTLSKQQQLEIRTEIGVAGRSNTKLSINVHHYRARLENLAQRIPDFESYRQMVVDDLRESWHYDRMHKGRTVHNQLQQWKRLFTYWARLVGERRLVHIGARGYDGAYECQLVERAADDVWERFIDAGVTAGVPLATLNNLFNHYKDAPAKTIRANERNTMRMATSSTSQTLLTAVASSESGVSS